MYGPYQVAGFRDGGIVVVGGDLRGEGRGVGPGAEAERCPSVRQVHVDVGPVAWAQHLVHGGGHGGGGDLAVWLAPVVQPSRVELGVDQGPVGLEQPLDMKRLRTIRRQNKKKLLYMYYRVQYLGCMMGEEDKQILFMA